MADEIMKEQGNGTAEGTEGLSVETVLGAIESNPELRKSVESQFLNKDTVGSFLETEAGKSIISPRLDQFASKAIESWKSKHLEGIVQERLQELNPPETQEQIQLRQMQSQLKEIQAEKDRLAMQSVASAALAATGLPASFADYVIGDSPEATKHNVNSLDVEINNLLSQRVEEKVKGIAAQTAPSNQDTVGVGGQREAKSLFDLSPQEAMQLKASNPAKYEALRRNS